MTATSKPRDILIIRREGQPVMSCDARHFPLLVISTDGQIDIPLYDQFFDWRTEWTDHAAATGTKVVAIGVLTTMKPMDAAGRKHVGDKVKNDGQLPGLLGSCIVVPNPILRGMVTAMLWLAGSGVDNIKNYGSLIDAVEAAQTLFAAANIKAPAFNPHSYQVPQ